MGFALAAGRVKNSPCQIWPNMAQYGPIWPNGYMARKQILPTGVQRRGDTYRTRIRRNGVDLVQTFDSVDEAVRWRDLKKAEVDGGDHRDLTRERTTSLRDILERYEREVAPAKKGHAQEVNRLKSWQRVEWTALPISAITPAHVSAWRDKRAADGKAPTTISNSMNLLSNVFKIAKAEWGYRVENPVQGIRRPKQRRGRVAVPDDALEALLIGRCEDSVNLRWMATWIVVAAWSAMRAGEIVALQWRDVDFDRHLVHLDITKNGEPRDVPMLPKVEAALRAWAGDHVSDPNAWIFPSPIDPRQNRRRTVPTNAFARLMADVLKDNPHVRRITMHDLRHWGVTRLAAYHVDAMDLSLTTGHKTVQMLRRYYNPDPAERAERIRAMAEAAEAIKAKSE